MISQEGATGRESFGKGRACTCLDKTANGYERSARNYTTYDPLPPGARGRSALCLGNGHEAFTAADELGLKHLQCHKLRNALRKLVPL